MSIGSEVKTLRGRDRKHSQAQTQQIMKTSMQLTIAA